MITWIILMSSLIAMSSSSWIMIWILMEINTMAVCTLISMESTTNSKKSAMIYTIVQLISSIIMILSILSTPMNNISMTVLLCAMAMKMGVAPFHWWYVKTLDMMKPEQLSMKIIMTWQKILPMTMIFYNHMYLMLMLLSILSLISPVSKLKKNISFKSTIILSSINNNGWFLLSCMCSMSIMWLFFTIYSLSLLMTLQFFKNLKTKNSSVSHQWWENSLVLLNLGGIPPSLNFLGKATIIIYLINFIPMEILTTMVLLSVVFLYFYSWASLTSLSEIKKNQMTITKSSKIPSLIMLLNISTLVSLFLCLLG